MRRPKKKAKARKTKKKVSDRVPLTFISNGPTPGEDPKWPWPKLPWRQ